jgi:hypothetical protein
MTSKKANESAFSMVGRLKNKKEVGSRQPAQILFKPVQHLLLKM